MKILLVIEHDNHFFKTANEHTLAAAKVLGADIDCLIAGYQCEKVVTAAKSFSAIKQILLKDAKDFEHQLSENMAPLVASLAKEYQYIVAPSSTFGKNLLPRVAALLDVAMISDVTKIISADTFVRPIYAGNAYATVKTDDAIKLLTIRTTAFSAEKKAAEQATPVKNISADFTNTLSQFVKQELTVTSRPDLTNARIVISGGRGLKSAENFKLLEELADHLGAALGASRAAVDAGFAPNDYQVGQTGKIVAPDLYIAVGISGAIQHLAGMKDSKVIVAINSDPDAPIFQVADYGLVGDLFKILPELQKALASS